MAEIALRPCPFCGGEAHVVEDPYVSGVFSVGCGNDRCLGFTGLGWTFPSPGAAAVAWNARAGGAREARIVADHGSHGPEPRFEGDCWTVSFTCSECGCHVSPGDAWCKHCSMKFEEVG